MLSSPYILSLSVILFINQANPAMTIETDIPLGSRIDAAGTQSWVSPSGRFAFGFYPEGEGFSIGVWLVIDTSRSVVWTANRDDPPVSGGSVVLTYGGSLQWIPANAGSQGKSISATSTPAASAGMLDTGNFVLFDMKKHVIWSTFSSPSDTLLPGQNLPPGSQLFSSVSDTNHATGKYRLFNQEDGNLVMYPVGAIDPDSSYWNTRTYGSGYLLTLSLDPNGTLWLFDQNSTYTDVLFLANRSSSNASPDRRQSFFHLTLGADGILRLYSLVFSGNGKAPITEVKWLQPSSDSCLVKGVCGPNSYCKVTANGETSCSCLPGFEFSISNQGCWRVQQIGGCANNDDIRMISTMVQVKNTSWSDNSYNVPPPTTSIEACKELCQSDCACEIAMFDSYCSKQMLPMRYGRMVPGSNITLYVKVYTRDTKVVIRKKASKSASSVAMLISGAALAIFSIAVLFVSTLLCKNRQALRYTRPPQQQDFELDETIGIQSYSFHDLELSTNNFAEELGRGAYGTVFKGVLTSNNKDVAVKRLEKMAENGEREFHREVRAIARTHHRNLVCLLGFCNQGMHRLLVYEYMPNGSLADILFKSDAPPCWGNRHAIALDVARGLQYLHEEIEGPIIHCDIKPENILIDSSGVAKIADFGLAKLLMGNQTQTFTGIRGTRGYLAPEWSKNMAITVKADVYSYGIMLLEMISCKKNMQLKLAGEECNISEWAYEYVVSGEVMEVAAGEGVNQIELERMLRIAIWCTQNVPVTRPAMKSIVQMLEGSAEVRQPPPPASFSQSLG
ncbi:hypothetical protein ACQ4PT_029864 [Festuca glaucescens]